MTQPTPAPTTDVLSAAVAKLLKPGSKTSEFVMLVAVYGGSLATLLGVFNTSSQTFNAVLKVAALVSAAAGQAAYALSRGNVKAALGTVASTLAANGVNFQVNVKTGKHAAPDPTSQTGAVDLIGLVAGVLSLAGLIWLIIGFTHHHLDVFGLILLIVGLGIYFLFGDGIRGATWRRRP